MKRAGCKICGKPLFRSTAKVCSVSCSLEYNLKYPEKVKSFIEQQEAKQWKEEKKRRKEKLKTLGQYEKEAKTVFQRWVRLRDQGLGCVSCGTMNSPVWDAGHWWKAELYSGLIFDPDNCHKQCRKCNFYLDGNEGNYREGLVKRYGVEFVARILAIKDKLRDHKYSKEELIRIKEMYQQKINQLKRAA